MKIIYGVNGSNDDKKIYVNNSNFLITSEITAFDKAIRFAHNLENPNFNGKKIQELFPYSDLSMWWFMYPSLIQSIKSSIEFIEYFEQLISKHNPTIIEIVSDFEKSNLLKQISIKYKIKFKYSKLKFIKFKLKFNIVSKIQKFRYEKITKTKIINRLKLFNDVIPKTLISDKIIFLIPTTYRRKIFNKNSTAKGEFLVQPILDSLLKMNQNTLCIDVDYSFYGNHSILEERLRSKDQSWIPLELLIKKKLTKEGNEFFKNYSNVISKQYFQKKFVYNDICFWKLIEQEFLKLSYKPNLPMYIQLLDSLTEVFKQNKPKLILLPYEAGPYALAMIASCRKNNIKTVGIQHGIIFGSNPDYSHIDFQHKKNPFGMILPDTFLIFGNSTKDILLKKKNYPPEKLFVFGHPMYFDYQQIHKDLKQKDLRYKFNISNKKIVILFTTGKYQSYYRGYEKQNYDERILYELIKNFSNNEKFHIILKPHPIGEYLDFYKRQIEKSNCNNFSIIDDDLFELLSISDLIISTFSTSLIDAIAFEKLSILVRFDENIPYPFNTSKVLLDTNIDMLTENIIKILHDVTLQNVLFSNRVNFIHDQFNIPNYNYQEQLKNILD